MATGRAARAAKRTMTDTIGDSSAPDLDTANTRDFPTAVSKPAASTGITRRSSATQIDAALAAPPAGGLEKELSPSTAPEAVKTPPLETVPAAVEASSSDASLEELPLAQRQKLSKVAAQAVAPRQRGRFQKVVTTEIAEEGSEDETLGMRKAKEALQRALDGTQAQDPDAATMGTDDMDIETGPEAAVEEEERLRMQRLRAEAKAEALRASQPKEDKELNKSQLEKLDGLLSRANAYSTFLREEMLRADEGTLEAGKIIAAGGRGAAAAGGKRGGAGGRGARSKKRAKTEAVPEHGVTQELLPLMVGEMRAYQLKGVQWLISLHKNGLNGILADEMGLGKTVQTIGFLSYLMTQGVTGPFLILGPLSTLPNWMSEFQRWCPSISTILYHGSPDERRDMQSGPLVPGKCKVAAIVTSYEIAMRDIKFLSRHKLKYLIVDEGHRLKNFESKLFRELKLLNLENKLLLTGTPLQNNLAELWALLNFLLPVIFSNLSDFESWFDFSAVGEEGGNASIVAAEQRNQVVSKLHGILKPFLLRRVKADVETNLPGKAEIILYAGMSDTQRRLNDELLNRTINETMAKEMAGQSRGVARLNNMMMQMRKNANHPDLITSAFEQSIEYPPPEEIVSESGKMQLLERILLKLRKGGHKVLIFSQMTTMLDLLHSYLEATGFEPCRIDGSVKWQDRQANMKAFNEDPDRFVFLLSTRAGGLGINLTSADTVIIYDSDWNPHADLQAMDRCHRIGQTRPVLILRLATGNSIEGRMLARAGSKLALEKLVIKRGAFVDSKEVSTQGLGADELIHLLKPTEESGDDPQSGVVDEQMLDTLLGREFLAESRPAPYPTAGLGYQVVVQSTDAGLLKGIE